MNDKGMLTIYIGPNGMGKTHMLNCKYEEQKDNSIFFPTETILKEETKDTVDSSMTMQIILDSLFQEHIDKYKKDIDNELNEIVTANKDIYNNLIKETLNINGTEQKSDFLKVSKKGVEFKKIISINNDDLNKKMGSGQGTLFMLKMLSFSKKNNVFIDEPEKFCHPSLLNVIAGEISKLIETGKNVFLVTHSSKLVKLLDWKFENLHIFNEVSYKDEKLTPMTSKNIDVSKIINDPEIAKLAKELDKGKSDYKIISKYLSSPDKMSKYLRIQRENIVELLFSIKCYLVEGINDRFFLNELLKNEGKQFDNHEIIITTGKIPMPIYVNIFNQIKSKGMELYSMFDKDSSDKVHSITNDYIEKNSDYFLMFDKNIEEDTNFFAKCGGKKFKNDTLLFIDHIMKEKSFLKFNFKKRKD